jgi:lipopolysaccharide/colanic/teichoic acid biosynthesis glycosyltransferase
MAGGKRALDLALAVFGSVALLPFGLALAALIALKLGRPVLFRQVRPGLGGAPFTLYKFRTMTDAVTDGGVERADDERLGRFGRFLRASGLDELPEIVNVLKGDMSLTGPRPLLTEYMPLYTSAQARRHEVRPGITGWAQVNGRNAVEWEERFRLDVWYVDNCSLLLDLKILAMTVRQVLSRRGVSASGCATMPRFTGSGAVGSDAEDRQRRKNGAAI